MPTNTNNTTEIKDKIITRLNELAVENAEKSGSFFGHNHTQLNLKETVNSLLQPTIHEEKGKVSVLWKSGYGDEFKEKYITPRNLQGFDHEYPSSISQNLGMLQGSLSAASRLANKNAETSLGNNSITFDSLLSLGMAVNALTPHQENKIDLSTLLGKSCA